MPPGSAPEPCPGLASLCTAYTQQAQTQALRILNTVPGKSCRCRAGPGHGRLVQGSGGCAALAYRQPRPLMAGKAEPARKGPAPARVDGAPSGPAWTGTPSHISTRGQHREGGREHCPEVEDRGWFTNKRKAERGPGAKSASDSSRFPSSPWLSVHPFRSPRCGGHGGHGHPISRCGGPVAPRLPCRGHVDVWMECSPGRT